jgi:ABC-type multidrug transport system fused ATPase/permease subunit
MAMSATRSCGESAGCHLDRRVTSGQPEGPGRLEARGVGLGDVLHGVDLVAEPGSGSVIAVVGPNGSGKSTRLTLLAGLVEPGRGSVLLDSVDVRQLDEFDLRKAIGLAGPDLPLLRGTIADNVGYGDPRADDVAAVVAASGVGEPFATLSDGLDTRVGECGRGLPTRQRQRVALARAVLARPWVLLLDEAGAHLDPVAAGAVDPRVYRCSSVSAVKVQLECGRARPLVMRTPPRT